MPTRAGRLGRRARCWCDLLKWPGIIALRFNGCLLYEERQKSVGYLVRMLAVVAILASTACAETTSSQVSGKSDWSVRCNTDAVTRSTECFAGTFGSPMNSAGQPFLPPAYPLKVYFLDGRGPYLQVGFHDFPGERPSIRFDSDRNAYTIPDDGGVSSAGIATSAVNRMQTALVARARFWTWPDGSRDMYVDLTGFAAAYAELRARIGK
jgi:hypothetical protein